MTIAKFATAAATKTTIGEYIWVPNTLPCFELKITGGEGPSLIVTTRLIFISLSRAGRAGGPEDFWFRSPVAAQFMATPCSFRILGFYPIARRRSNSLGNWINDDALLVGNEVFREFSFSF